MNSISLSVCGKWVQLWHNGAIIRQHHIGIVRIHEAVDELKRHIHKWAGDENPEVSAELTDKMKAADANLSRMAFGAEWK